MSVCRPSFTDEEHAALQATVSTTEIFDCVGWQNVIRPKQNTAMCAVKTESGRDYKSSQARVQVKVQQKMDSSPDSRVLQVWLLALLLRRCSIDY